MILHSPFLNKCPPDWVTKLSTKNNTIKVPMKKNTSHIAQRKIAGFGWSPDLPDQRDHLFSAPLLKLGPLPAKVDLRKQCPKVYDQGQIGSCTANAIAGAIEFDLGKQKLA